ncbi:DUF742 domain-containing protein [Kibdelosporangium phytohabitans]|uniref:Multi-component regulatory system-8 n=1 Tax=Kibdelosporangium phytohabitans TaxID=860235 RepID=A0A0N9HZI3_9PSEU|nr:DUF742 domain-containing protein [Kibdelosporangium phytohabitans]ALG12725.1 hypothetical protein AOZ06_42970 [Kibdelosporangium phytohabitans]MBE1464394.1 hypothetical protein [Kibdelosporangium phytohabitans]
MTIHEDAPPSPTFADVLNGLTFGKRAGESADVKPTPGPRLSPTQPQPVLVEMPDDDPAMVRPYAMTGGRTKADGDLRVEAMISTAPAGMTEDGLAEIEHRSIARLCRTPKSVAEISAELEMPLQVAKIVLGDMVATGLVVVHRTTGLSGGSSHLALMERVLGGLRRL